MMDLTMDVNLVRKILTGFIHSEITRMGFSHAVINLSGGIDSALSCVLAAEALGPKNVLAIRLPYKTSSADSLEHAQLVIDATGVLKGKTRRALDSTLLDDAVATQDTVTQLIAAVRRVRRLVPGANDVVLSAHDYETSGKPLIA